MLQDACQDLQTIYKTLQMGVHPFIDHRSFHARSLPWLCISSQCFKLLSNGREFARAKIFQLSTFEDWPCEEHVLGFWLESCGRDSTWCPDRARPCHGACEMWDAWHCMRHFLLSTARAWCWTRCTSPNCHESVLIAQLISHKRKL
jgi:hypothetical protein